MKQTVWKSSLNFVMDVFMIYVNYTIIVIIVYEKK
jgi:hypothetical protein